LQQQQQQHHHHQQQQQQRTPKHQSAGVFASSAATGCRCAHLRAETIVQQLHLLIELCP
jgi:hypothetical protein